MPDTQARTKGGRAAGAVYPEFSVDDLLLDHENPRLSDLGIAASADQFDLLRALWEKMAVQEIAMSIAYNGYFPHEPLFLEPHGKKYVVIEGNRRFAAVKLLLSSSLRQRLHATDLPDIDRIDPKRRRELANLPGIVTTRKDAWRYLGFKHVNGPATWGSYAKAQYIAKVHNDYGVPLDEIAKQIGDYSATVARMYRGLMVIEQAEHSKVFNRRNTSKPKFHFNYIYSGLDYPGIQNFLGLQGKQRAVQRPVPAARLRQLGQLCEWLYGNKAKGRESLIKSQNPDLKTLSHVLEEPKGVKALKDGLPLQVAHDISLGDERLFRAAVQEAKASLQRAHGTMSTGYDPVGGSDVLTTANDVERLAGDLVTAMVTKKRQRRARPSSVKA